MNKLNHSSIMMAPGLSFKSKKNPLFNTTFEGKS